MECLHLHTGISHTENICVCKFPGKQREEQEESTFIFSLSSKAEVAIICLLYLDYLQRALFNPYLLNYWIWLDKWYLWMTMNSWISWVFIKHRSLILASQSSVSEGEMVEIYTRFLLLCSCCHLVWWGRE